MKNSIIYTITAILILAGIQTISQAQIQITTSGSWLCSMKKSTSHCPELTTKSINTPLHSFDVLNYNIYLDIFNCYLSAQQFTNAFSGYVTINFRADSVINQIKLDAASNSIIVDSVKMDGVSFTHLNDILTINLNNTYNPGEEAYVMIFYHHPDIYDGSFFASDGFVFTDAEPEGARHWFPCWDKPSDKATLDIWARVPLNVKLGSNGTLQDSIFVGNAIIYHWVSIHPVATYLIAVTSKANYLLDIVYWENPLVTGQLTPIRFYYNQGEDPSYIESIICDMTSFFSSILCDHPFEKNGFASLNQEFVWGGMENQTLTSICNDCWIEGLIAHEFAHQWFGDMITLGTWADIWLNEGFATYGEALWDEHAYGYQAYKDNIESNAQYYLNPGNNPGWAISNPDWAVNTPGSNTLFNYAITYAKGACVLHMLRYVLGDSLFFETLKSYSGDTTEFKYKNAVIQDFTTKLNSVTGQDLSWFINQWIYYPNHPVYFNEYSFVQEISGQWKVYFNSQQIQSANFFKMPIELKIYFTDFTDTTVKVINEYNDQMFVFSFNKAPYMVEFDPSNNIVLKDDSLLVGVFTADQGINDIELFPVAPNPADQSVNLSFHLTKQTFIDISIIDLYGNQITRLTNQMYNKGHHDLSFDCSVLLPGVYLVRLTGGNISLSRKITVIH